MAKLDTKLLEILTKAVKNKKRRQVCYFCSIYKRNPQKAVSLFKKLKKREILLEDKNLVISKQKLVMIKLIVDQLNTCIMKCGGRVDRVHIYSKYSVGGKVISHKSCGCCYLLRVSKKEFSSRNRFISLFEHEFAHVLLYVNPKYQRISESFFKKMNLRELRYFTDDRFIPHSGGHPQDSGHELFASVFMLASMLAEGFLKKNAVRPPKGPAREYWQWINSLPLFKIRAAIKTSWK